MALTGRPTWNLDSSVRSRTPHPASSVTSRWVVETGRQVSLAISVSECSLPSRNVSKIATTLLVTDRPGSDELPAIGPPLGQDLGMRLALGSHGSIHAATIANAPRPVFPRAGESAGSFRTAPTLAWPPNRARSDRPIGWR